MRRARGIAVAFAGIAVLGIAALLAWRASEHGPGLGAEADSATPPTPTDGPEEAPVLLEAHGGGGSPHAAPSTETAGDAPEGGGEAVAAAGAAARPDPKLVPVTLRLLRSDGGTVDRAYAHQHEHKSRGGEWDPQTCVVSLPLGDHHIEVQGGRFGEWRQPEDFRIDVRAGMAPVEATLRPWRMIVGHLNAAENGPAVSAGALLRMIERKDGEEADFRAECGVLLRPPYDGWFKFGEEHELKPGTYEVSATTWHRGPIVATQQVVVADTAVVVEMDLPRRPRSDGVTLRVEDPDGHPVAPTAVKIEVLDNQGGGGSSGASLEWLGEGRYWLPTVLPGYSGRTPVSATLWVRSEYGERGIDLRLPNTDQEVLVRFEKPAQLALKLTHRNGWLAESSKVSVWRLVRDGRRLVEDGTLDDDGKAQFGAMQPGDYWVAATGTRVTRWVKIALAPVTLKSGLNSIEVAAPLLHPLQVHEAARDAFLTSADAFKSGGTLRWPQALMLPAGSYTLESGELSVTAEVPMMSEVTFETGKPR